MCVSSKEEPSKANTAAQMGELSMKDRQEREGDGLLLWNTIEHKISILLTDKRLLVVLFYVV